MVIFKRVSRENQVCKHIFLLHHPVAGKRLKLQSKMKQIYGKAFLYFLILKQFYTALEGSLFVVK